MPAQVVTGQLNFNFQSFLVQTTGLINSTQFSELISQSFQYINSTGVAYGVDQLYAAQITLASTSQTIHFETATAHDPGGNTLAMLRIRELVIQNLATTAGFDLTVEASASNGVTWLPVAANTPPICYAGGLLRFSDPISIGGGVGQVVGATTDGITFVSASHTVTFNIVALGCSVA